MGTQDDTTGVRQSMNMSPPPYYDTPSRTTTTTFITTVPAVVTTVTTGPAVGPTSTPMTCPSCNAAVMTTVENKPTIKTHLLALFLCIICCPCVFVPYCMKTCQDVNHYCPNCNSYIGKYEN